ncbi:MAG: glutamate synthase subunit beta [Polyangiales bacterium]
MRHSVLSQGCPLGNHIPDWNDLVYRGDFRGALARLHATNNFPEFTGHTCPAPCEDACVLTINDDAVTIKQVEKEIIDRAWSEGWIEPVRAAASTGRSVAVVGSGPAGLAVAQQLVRVGHAVTVYERDDRAGGLLRYGIPDFKLEKIQVERRVKQLEAEGVTFKLGVNVGGETTLDDLRNAHDAVCLAVGAQKPRDMPIQGRELAGVHLAMDYLTQQNRVVAGDAVSGQITAKGKRVVILGGGDTGADCLGTAHRQGAAEVHHFHYKPAPPEMRTEEMPWPWYPMILRESSSHEEGGERDWAVLCKAFEGSNGKLERLRCVRVRWDVGPDGRAQMIEIDGSEFHIDADLALIAIGFVGAEAEPLGDALSTTRRGTVESDDAFRTNLPGVFACGDARRGASLVVWAIWEGREVARAVDTYLMGSSSLPSSPNPNPIS